MTEAHHVDILIIGAGAAGQAAVESAAAAVAAHQADEAGSAPAGRAPRDADRPGTDRPGTEPAGGADRRAARSLSICLVSDEDRLPYKRTKISKTMAQGFEADAFAVQSEEWYREHGVELLTGTEVTRIDPERRMAELGNGKGSITFERLILATGAGPRLPEAEAGVRGRIHCTHDIADVEELRAAALRAVAVAPAGETPHAVVLGGGVLGLEVGHDLHQLGLHVAVVDRNERPMHRELDAYAGEIVMDQCRRHGLDLYLGETDYRVGASTGSRPIEVALPRAGVTIRADVVAAALGVVPHSNLAAAAGLDTGRGIRVDRELRASAPAVLAAGDCAEHPDGRVTHLWRDALRQGAVAGANAVADILGRSETEPYVYEPFRLKCEIFDTYFFSLCRPSPEQNDDYGHRRYYDGPRYVHAYLRRDGHTDSGAGVGDSARVAGVIMVNDKERHRRYEEAIREGWTIRELEEAFGLA